MSPGSGFSPGLGDDDGADADGDLTTSITASGTGESATDSAATEGTSSPGEGSGGSTAGVDPSAGTEDPSASTGTSVGQTETDTATTTDPTAGDSSSTGTPAVGDPLDPDLDVPDEGEACDTPGSLSECPGIAVCRFHTTEQGRCESCDECGNLNAPCTEGTDCDILFSCFQGRCTNFCPLGTYACGAITDCLDVGHPTHGVCDPFA